MRIGIDARLWNETGVGRYIRNLIWQLQVIDKKNEYVVFVKLGTKKTGLGIKNEKWKVVEVDIDWHTIEEQLLFYKVLDNEQLDLVHFPYFSIPILYTKPFVITIHDLIINHFPTGKASTLPFPVYKLKHFAYNFVIKQAAKKAKKIITVSEATKKEIIDHLPVSEDKVVVTYEGVDTSLRGNKKQSSSESVYFLYVGNAYPHKNLNRLVEAFALNKKEYPEVKLTIVGEKNYFTNRLEEKVRQHDLLDTIIFAGKVSDKELSNLYQNAQALITPSLMEGFGLPGLEAMKHETLVLASDIPVFKEIYQDAAIYFNPLSPEAIHATIRKVLDKKSNFEKHIEKGKERVAIFSWEKMAKKTLEVYESSISIRPSK